MNEAPDNWKSSGVRWLWIALLIVIVDQLTKLWIERNMALGDGFDVLPVLEIVRAHNPGAAFSFLASAGGWQRWAFSLLAVGVSIAFIIWLRRLPLASQKPLITGIQLILGGAVGNVLDRLEHGYVVDFVHVHWDAYSFPAFNVADAGISIGAVFVIFDALTESRRARRQALSKQAGTDS